MVPSGRGKGMARIQSVDPERARGLRKALVWMAKRQYGGAVSGIFKILAQDLNIGLPASWLYKPPAHAQGPALEPPATRDARHGDQRPDRRRPLT
jgi:hypothetical protein